MLGGALALVMITVAFALAPLLDQRHRVVVDPGHGGTDTGAPGIVQEAEMTERTAEILTALLKEDGRFKVWHTRRAGDSATLSERCKTALVHRADLLLSIHGNSAEDAGAAGFECYPAPPGRTHHEQSVQFALLLASRMEEAGAFLRGSSGLRYAYYLEDGQKELVDAGDSTIRQEPSFAMVESSGCPAVLAEQCFVTNARDVDQFGDEDGCQLAARQYYLAILDYFGEAALESP